MKRTFLLSLSCCVASACCLEAVDSRAVKRLFADPPREYATAPLWVWNDLLTETQIRSTLRDLAGQQVRQVFVHPRPGLMTPYLSPDWFRLWKAALDEAKRLDMNVWIYDENSYPSGFAGGWVPELMPESRGRGLALREAKNAPPWKADLIGVYRLGDGNAENVTARIRANESLPEARYVTATEVRAGDSPWTANRCYVNLLTPGVTEKFLEVTLEAYRREIGDEFGRRVPGVFTDEPNIRPAGELPWTEDLPGEFQKRWGYDLLGALPSLSFEVGDWRKVRHNYFATLNDLFIERWAKPYHDYCARHRLEFTGHYWDHEWPHCAGVPDNMAMYAWHQRPAIDCLMNQYAENTHAQFGNLRMVRELSSVANQLGRPRTLCEIYGAGGWDLRFEDMKRIGDWLEVLGVNTLDQHLSYVTLRGARKRDHPQSFSYHEPWWEAYHVSARYLTRLSAALSQGQQVNPILVLEPTTTAWMYQGNEAKLKEIGDTFFGLLKNLEAAQVEYDLGDEDLIARHGAIAGGDLQVGERKYPVVVIPPGTENLNARTAGLLADLVKAGGTIVACGEPPSHLDGRADPQFCQTAGGPNWLAIQPDAAPGVLRKWSHPDAWDIARKPGDAGILLHHRRRLADGEILFLVNTSLEAPSSGTVTSAARGVEVWDLNTGQTGPYAFERTPGGVRAAFELPPCGSLLLFLSQQSLRPPKAPKVNTTRTMTVPGLPQIERVEPNVLTLDYVDVTAGGETRSNVYFYQANQFAWQKNGLDRDPWDSAVQFKAELISRKFAPDSGFTARYRFALEGPVPPDLAIVVERPDLYTLACNGQPVTPSPGAWWLDHAFGRIPLAGAAHAGENEVTLRASPFTMFHELEPAYLLGNFTLKPAEKGFVVGPPQPLTIGQWNEQGHPFYSAGVVYRQPFHLAKQPEGRYWVVLPRWYGSVARVVVNAKPAGYITAAPWECEVTPQLRKGDNRIEVTVIGTLKNTLGPHHGRPGLGSAWPGMFQNGPKDGPPPGAQYSNVGYGLFEPFTLKQVVRR